MFYKDISKAKNALTKSYYNQLNEIIIQGVTFFGVPNMMDYLQHCINEISSYYDSEINGHADAFVDSIVKDALKDEKTKD